MAMTATRSTGDLFGEAPRGVYLATNHYNLLEVLSSGFVPTRPGFDKYYADLTQSAPDRVVLLAGPVPVGLCETVSADGASSFPVLIEFDSERIAGPATETLGTDASTTTTVATESGILAWAYGGPLPLVWATRIHFRSDRDHREYSARRFENVPRDRLPSTVSPDLFDGSGDSDALVAWLRTLPGGGPQVAEYRATDRRSGAKTLAAAVMGMSASSLRGFTCYIRPSTEKPSGPSGEGWPEWVGGNGAAGVERDFFAAAEAVMLETDPDLSWRPLELVEAVRGRIGSRADELVRTTLTAMTAILRNDREFRPFTPGTGLNSAKALLMVLMRRDPAALLSWAPEETGADDEVRIGAAVLCGLLHGRKRLSTTLRPTALDAYLATVAALELTPDPPAPLATLAPVVEETLTEEGALRVALRWNGAELLARSVPRPSLAEVLSRSDLATEPGRGMALEVSRRMGWSESVRTVAIGDSAMVSSPAGVRSRCVRVVFEGFAEVFLELNVESFRRHLSETPIPPEVEQAILARPADRAEIASPTRKRTAGARRRGTK